MAASTLHARHVRTIDLPATDKISMPKPGEVTTNNHNDVDRGPLPQSTTDRHTHLNQTLYPSLKDLARAKAPTHHMTTIQRSESIHPNTHQITINPTPTTMILIDSKCNGTMNVYGQGIVWFARSLVRTDS